MQLFAVAKVASDLRERLVAGFVPGELPGANVVKLPVQLTTGLMQRLEQERMSVAAARDLADYQRLTAEGKLGEAGQKLEALKQKLEALNRRSVK